MQNIWTEMQRYYSEAGTMVWEDELVPSHITSIRTIAELYARTIRGILQDNVTQQYSSEPLNIIELGSGAGKSAFLILKELEYCLARFKIPFTRIRYIMTDISDKTIAKWQQNPAFIRFVELGVLDFAYFDATQDKQLTLINQGIVIGKAQQCTLPIVVICNYVFDSLPNDSFLIKNHELYHIDVGIKNPGKGKDYFNNAEFTFKHTQIDATTYYENERLANILKFYQNNFKDACIGVPIGGIQAYENLEKFSSNGAYLLIADKGHLNLDNFADVSEPDIQVHGSFSFVVNFDALARYFAEPYHFMIKNRDINAELQLALIGSYRGIDPINAANNFYENLAPSPQDIINMLYFEEEVRSSYANLDELIAILNTCLWDPSVFYDLHEHLLKFIDDEDYEINIEQENTIASQLPKVWEYFFMVEKDNDVAFAIANVYYALDYFEEAIKYFRYSLEYFGHDDNITYNIRLCEEALAKHQEEAVMD